MFSNLNPIMQIFFLGKIHCFLSNKDIGSTNKNKITKKILSWDPKIFS